MNEEQQKFIDLIENDFDALRDYMYRQLKKPIEKQALALGVNCGNYQMGLSLKNGEVRTEEFEQLETFLAQLSDNYGIEPYFEVKNGIFTWLTEIEDEYIERG